MQVISPKVKILEQLDCGSTLDDSSTIEDISNAQGDLFENIINHIENCNDILMRDSLQESVKRGESLDVLEHGTVYLTVPIGKPDPDDTSDYMNRMQIVNFYQNNLDSVVRGYKSDQEGVLYVYFITTNYRIIIENNRHSDLAFLFNRTEYHIKRNTFSIVTNRHVANKISQLKCLSTSISDPIIEDGITVLSNSFNEYTEAKNSWINLCKDSYNIYKSLIENGLSKSNAYKILPDTVAVNVIVTGFEDDFEDIIKTLDINDDIDYSDIIHMIAYDHDNSKIIEEIANEVVEKNSEESGEIQAAEETGGDAELSE